jgi:hypothetical protein
MPLCAVGAVLLLALRPVLRGVYVVFSASCWPVAMRAAIERFLRLLATEEGHELDWMIDAELSEAFGDEFGQVIDALETALRENQE